MRWFFASSARHAITANTVSAGRLPRVIALLQDVHLRKPADGSTSGPRCLPRRRAWPKSSRGGRIPGADVNPYLAAAAMIAAGLHGVDNELPLEAAFDGNAYTAAADRVPTTLRDAAELWRNSALARKAFGDEVVAHYTNAARMEIAALDSAVTDWENPQLRAHLRTEALSHTAIRIAAAPLTWPDADGQPPLRPSRATPAQWQSVGPDCAMPSAARPDLAQVSAQIQPGQAPPAHQTRETALPIHR